MKIKFTDHGINISPLFFGVKIKCKFITGYLLVHGGKMIIDN